MAANVHQLFSCRFDVRVCLRSETVVETVVETVAVDYCTEKSRFIFVIHIRACARMRIEISK